MALSSLVKKHDVQRERVWGLLSGEVGLSRRKGGPNPHSLGELQGGGAGWVTEPAPPPPAHDGRWPRVGGGNAEKNMKLGNRDNL